MGNFCAVEGAIDHWIYVKTGDRKAPGSKVNIKVILHDDRQQRSQEIELNLGWGTDAVRGHTDIFQTPRLKHFGPIKQIEVWRDDDSQTADWYCELIIVNDARKDQCYYFPLQRWMEPNFRYAVPLFDTSLPQHDPYPDQRRHGLERKRLLYTYAQQAPDFPVQILALPDDEMFSDDYQFDLESGVLGLLSRAASSRIAPGPWTCFEDLANLYKYDQTFPEPQGLQLYGSDVWFGAQRLVGCNPTVLALCTDLPENLGVTMEMLAPFMEGWKVPQILAAKRLFVADYRILHDLPTRPGLQICAPIALFFLNGEKQLLPIAIQLRQHLAPDNPVFLCNDPPFTWKLAKLWLNHADAALHQCLTHIAYTHLLMEGAVIATHRCLASTHPLFRLLAPHFQFLLPINSRAVEYLVQPGGWLDQATTVGRDGMVELVRRGLAEWRMDLHGNLPRELESRRVLDARVLPCYPYRDDGLLIHKAIEGYVSKIVRYHYGTPERITEDVEVQAWAAELARPTLQGGVGIQGVPHGGRFKTCADIISVMTSLIYTCSAQHAAISRRQYDEYGFPANYPALLLGNPPTDKSARSEDDLLSILPDQAVTLSTMAVTQMLSGRASKNLGEWEFQFQYTPATLVAEKEFREELSNISRTIQERNQHRPRILYYDCLDPQNVPNAISI